MNLVLLSAWTSQRKGPGHRVGWQSHVSPLAHMADHIKAVGKYSESQAALRNSCYRTKGQVLQEWPDVKW